MTVAAERLRCGLLLAGFAALVIGPFVLPTGRTRPARDPFAAAVLHVAAIVPGQPRKEVESRLRRIYRRPDGVEVFASPDSEFLRLDLRFAGPGQEDPVTAIGNPYLAPYPRPDHL